MRPGLFVFVLAGEGKSCVADYNAVPEAGMGKSRRQFLTVTSAGLIGAAVSRAYGQAPTGQQPSTPVPEQQQTTPGAPTAFGTGPLVGPEIKPQTVTEAEKLVQIEMSQPNVEMAAASWRP